MAIRIQINFSDDTPHVVTSLADTPRLGDVLTFPAGYQYTVLGVEWSLVAQPMRPYDVALTVAPVEGS